MPDILSHVSVRARNEGCLFATVFDAGKLAEMEQLAGQAVTCAPSASADDSAASSVLRRRRRASLGAAPGGGAAAGGASGGFGGAMSAPGGRRSSIPPARVHGQARRAVPRVHRPRSSAPSPVTCRSSAGAFPTGSTSPRPRRCRSAPSTSVLASPDERARAASSSSRARARARRRWTSGRPRTNSSGLTRTHASRRSQHDRSHGSELLARDASVVRRGASRPGRRGRSARKARGGVGAGVHGLGRDHRRVGESKYNERAVLSCRKAGITHEDVSMAVLCQPVVQARVRVRVAHGEPADGRRGRDLRRDGVRHGRGARRELRRPRALLRRQQERPVQPRKSPGSRPRRTGCSPTDPRSSSARTRNGEDLEGFAGAGLYDSIQMHEPTLRPVDYSAGPARRRTKQFRAQALAGGHRARRVRGREGARARRRTSRVASPPNGALYVVQTQAAGVNGARVESGGSKKNRTRGPRREHEVRRRATTPQAKFNLTHERHSSHARTFLRQQTTTVR